MAIYDVHIKRPNKELDKFKMGRVLTKGETYKIMKYIVELEKVGVDHECRLYIDYRNEG